MGKFRAHLRFLPLLALLAVATPRVGAASAGDAPPRFTVPVAVAGPLVFVAYGDTRFTQREGVVNAFARRALVEGIAREHPVAVLIGGDLVYQGSEPDDYELYRNETSSWKREQIPVFAALGNHEFKGCRIKAPDPCLENWWNALTPLAVRPYRWYSLSIGPSLLALILDSGSSLKPGSTQHAWLEEQIANADPGVRFILIVLHYPPVRDPLIPRAKDEKEIARYLARNAGRLRQRVIVVGSHVHNYERYFRDGVTYLVSGGGGAKPVPSLRMFGEQSQLRTSVNYHYIRFTLEGERLKGTMVRFDASTPDVNAWSEPDHFEVSAKD